MGKKKSPFFSSTIPALVCEMGQSSHSISGPCMTEYGRQEQCGWLDRNRAQEWANTSGTWWSQVIDQDHALVLSDYCLITGVLKAWVLHPGISHPAEMEPQSIGGLC